MGIAARLPDRLRQGAGGRRRLAADRGHRLHHASPTPTRPAATQLAARFHDLGFEIIATRGTAQAISRMGIPVRAINKIGEGSPHVVDFIRDGEVDLVINTPTGSRRALRRLRDPHRRGPPGHPLHDDDDRRLGGRAGDLRRSATRGAEPRTLQELHDGAREPSAREPSAGGVTAGCSAPFGRRVCEVVANARPAATGSSPRSTRAGPSPAAGQFYMLAARRAGAATAGGPFLPRAFSVADGRAAADGGRRASTSCVEAVGPGHRARSRRSSRASGCWLTGPARAARSRPRPSSRRAPPGRSSSAAGSASRRSRSCAASSPSAASPSRVLLGFRDRAHSGGLELFDCEEVRLASEDGHAGHQGYVTDLLAVLLEGDDAAQRRRLRLRPAGDARGGAGDLRRARGRRPSWRWRRRWPAASAPASAARCRSPAGGYMRLCVDGPVVARRRDRDGARRRERGTDGADSIELCGLELEHPVINGSGTFDAIAARRAFGDAAARALPVLGLRLEDDHPRAAGRQPAAAPLRDAGRDDQLDRAARTRGSTASSPQDLPQLAELAGAADRLGDGDRAARSSRGSSRGSAARDEVAAIELNVSCPNVKSGLIVGEQPARDARAARGAARR